MCVLTIVVVTTIRPTIVFAEQNTLHVDLRALNQPIGEVIAEINRNYGYRITLATEWRDNVLVTETIEQATVEQMFRRLLRRYDYVLVQDSLWDFRLYIFERIENSTAHDSQTEPPEYADFEVASGVDRIDEIAGISSIQTSAGAARYTLRPGPDGIIEAIPVQERANIEQSHFFENGAGIIEPLLPEQDLQLKGY